MTEYNVFVGFTHVSTADTPQAAADHVQDMLHDFPDEKIVVVPVESYEEED